MDVRDWFIIGSVGALQIAATAFLFRYPSVGAFATWAGVATTLVSAYHWICYKDDKTKDEK